MRLTRLLTFVGAFLYVCVIHLCYVYYVSPRYAYKGFIYNNPQTMIVVVAFVLAILPVLVLPIGISRPSTVVYWFLYLWVVAPSILILFYVSTRPLWHTFAFAVTIWVAFFLSVCASRFLPLYSIPRFRIQRTAYWSLFFLMYVVILLYLVTSFAGQMKVVSLNDVYRLRLQAREVFATHPPILAYVFNWYGSVFNVLLLAYGLAYWKLFYVFLGVAGQILHYSIAANKAVLFSVPFMLIISASLKRWRARFGALIMWGLIGMIVVSVLMDVLLFKRPYVTAFAVVRVILMPGLLTADYYDFFSTHQWAYWSYSFLRYLIVYPYDREPPFLIGQIYFHNPATSANANLWADGFANAGFVGVILVSLVLGFIMWIYDSIMRNKPAVLGVLCLALPSFLLSNASLQTFMSTKGFALLLLWLLFMPDPLKHQVGLRFSDREEITWSLQHSTRPKRSYT